MSLLEWLLEHPPTMIAALVVAAAALVWWIARPVTWQDGEGSVVDDDSVDRMRGVAGWFFRWWR